MKKYSYARLQAKPGSILQRMADSAYELNLCWLGNDGWLIRNREYTVAFDLDLLDRYRIARSSVKIEEVAPHLDYLFITHEHNDHFHAETADRLNHESNCRFVLPESCLEKAKSLNIPKERCITACPGQLFHIGDMEVEPIRAVHGHIKNTIYKGASLKDCGYILNLDGVCIYQPGDTVLLQEHLEMKNIDILFVSPTEHNTWVDPSAEMIKAIAPAFIFPQHYDTYPVDSENFFWTRGYTGELYNILPQEFKQRYFKVSQGEIFALSIVGQSKE